METKQFYMAPETELMDISTESGILTTSEKPVEASAFGMYIKDEGEF